MVSVASMCCCDEYNVAADRHRGAGGFGAVREGPFGGDDGVGPIHDADIHNKAR